MIVAQPDLIAIRADEIRTRQAQSHPLLQQFLVISIETILNLKEQCHSNSHCDKLSIEKVIQGNWLMQEYHVQI